ncbi:putative metalloprotease CJM1_0395 family protein [Marinobacterium sediminicola]|uniref:SprA-related family protein n=1 Tax=Marinobacterium sediminicola TaxID=518898 RepID=A0ABY1S020_9GAMM|nr:putative metalloprotease CJM1_0395 family protein [Marinobacterium sediminicola]ULG70007.1 SprA-related family protein [Marinobacterium sediminicola]SMR74461.1 SprA-related family protein [Marinobacterium sediminicola]
MPIATPGSGATPAAGDELPGRASAAGSARENRSDSLTPESDKARQPSEMSTKERAQELQEQQVVRQLSARDREVRQHEMAHQAAGGGHTGAVSYTFQRGPDGRMYAVGGEVSIDTSAVSGDPRATLEKAEAIIRAAMAPAEPSSQDYRVAASARAMAAEARAELAKLEESEQEDTAEADDAGKDESVSEAESTQSKATGNAQLQDTARQAAPQPLNTVQQQLIEAGVYTSLYPSGSLLNLQA